jgi:hypothetical protein
VPNILLNSKQLLFIECHHGRGDIGSRDDVLLVLDSSLNDRGVVSVRNQAAATGSSGLSSLVKAR